MPAANMVASDEVDLEQHLGAKWKHVDLALRMIAKQRGSLDVNEARWLRAALRVKIWREVGCVSMVDYLERRLGYAPRTGQDRLRVALALESLPKLEAAMNNGLPHSAVRELTRVVTDQNEQTWLDAVRGKTVHEIESMVAGRGKGSDPEDPPHPNLVGRTLPFEAVRPATMALLRDARRRAQDDRGSGEAMSDDDFLATLARAFLEGNSAERTKAPYQIAVTLCEHCGRGWQESGRKYELARADLEHACCDAERIGSLDPDDRKRAVQDVPPSVRRFVTRRDVGRCKVPGCRSARCLEIHHIVSRSLGGTNDPENLALLCDGCHTSLHRELITITGTASQLIMTRRYDVSYDQSPANDESTAEDFRTPGRVDPAALTNTSIGIEPSAHVGAPDPEPEPRVAEDGVTSWCAEAATDQRFDLERLRVDARSALVELGFRSPQAGKAVDLALQRLGRVSLEEILREALRSCAPK